MRAVCLVSGQEIINYSYFPFSIGRLKKSDNLQLIFKNLLDFKSNSIFHSNKT